MLMIRLQRIGRTHEPAFRLVLTDSKNSTKSGRFLEILGNYDARRGDKAEFKSDRISYWISVGAQTSPTVHNLLVDKNIIKGKKINKLPKKSAPVKEIPVEVKQEAKKEETPASVETTTEDKIDEVVESPVVEDAVPVTEETVVA